MEPSIPEITCRADAAAFLDERIDRGVEPGLERTSGLLEFLGRPERDYPVVHVAGTNGKTTVTRLVADILGAHGLRTGTFTSPHLHRIEERFSIEGAPITPGVFTEAVSDIAWFVEEYERRAQTGVTYFEVTAALAFSLFAAAAVDVAVVEVGMGGRLDATSVVDPAVAVITGIALDHVEYLGTTIGEIAGEKAAILGEGGLIVTGPLPAEAVPVVSERVEATGSRWFRYGESFSLSDAVRAVGGWSVDISGVYADYPDVYLPIHGRHQTGNLATAVAASETFLERALDPDALREAIAATIQPGRIEVVERHPLVIVDGAHNVQGFEGLAAALREEFPDTLWHVVAGMRGNRDPGELLAPLAGLVRHLWATAADDPQAIPPGRIARAGEAALSCPSTVVDNVADALGSAVEEAGEEGNVVVAGSLYVAGEARAATVGTEFRPSGVHVRYEAPVSDGDEDDEEPWIDTDEAWTEDGHEG